MAIQQVNKFVVNMEDKEILSEASRLLTNLDADAKDLQVEGQLELKQAIYHLDLFLSTVGVDNALSPEHNLDEILDTQGEYDEGYEDGKAEGYDEGYDDGYSAGYTQGTEENGGDE